MLLCHQVVLEHLDPGSHEPDPAARALGLGPWEEQEGGAALPESRGCPGDVGGGSEGRVADTFTKLGSCPAAAENLSLSWFGKDGHVLKGGLCCHVGAAS